MIAILVSMALMGQVEEPPPTTEAEAFSIMFMPYAKMFPDNVKHAMADRSKFYKRVADGAASVEIQYRSTVRGLIRQDLSETEKIIKAKETPRNLKSLAKVHFRNACDALAVLEKQNPGK